MQDLTSDLQKSVSNSLPAILIIICVCATCAYCGYLQGKVSTLQQPTRVGAAPRTAPTTTPILYISDPYTDPYYNDTPESFQEHLRVRTIAYAR